MRSKFEETVEKQLKSKRKFSTSYETERLTYKLLKTYIPDFILTFKDGRKIYLEVKGYLRPSDRTKLLAVKEMNPQIDLRLVFMQDNKLNKNSKTTYSQWATKHGFPYCFKTIPKEWLT